MIIGDYVLNMRGCTSALNAYLEAGRSDLVADQMDRAKILLRHFPTCKAKVNRYDLIEMSWFNIAKIEYGQLMDIVYFIEQEILIKEKPSYEKRLQAQSDEAIDILNQAIAEVKNISLIDKLKKTAKENEEKYGPDYIRTENGVKHISCLYRHLPFYLVEENTEDEE